MNSLSASRFYNEFSICFANFVRIHHRFREITFCFAYWPWIHYPFRKITISSLSASRCLLKFTMVFGTSLSFLRIQLGSIFFREITIDSLSFSRFQFEFTILFPKSLWIHYFFAKSIWIYYLFRLITLNPLFFAKSL